MTPKKRIGYKGGANEVFKHPWFPHKGFISKIERKEVTAPITPSNTIEEINHDFLNIVDLGSEEIDPQQLKIIQANPNAFDCFNDFDSRKN